MGMNFTITIGNGNDMAIEKKHEKLVLLINSISQLPFLNVRKKIQSI